MNKPSDIRSEALGPNYRVWEVYQVFAIPVWLLAMDCLKLFHHRNKLQIMLIKNNNCTVPTTNAAMVMLVLTT